MAAAAAASPVRRRRPKDRDGLTDMEGKEFIAYTPKTAVGKALVELAEGGLGDASPPKVTDLVSRSPLRPAC